MPYVDGFVIAVPTENLSAYRKMAKKAAKIWMEYGALSVVESWGDDVPEGKTTSFRKAVKAKPDETVVFSWITYKSKRARDTINRKVMADPRLQMDKENAPFDPKRMIWGGFKSIVTESIPEE